MKRLIQVFKYLVVLIVGSLIPTLLQPFGQLLQNATQPIANRLMPQTLQITPEGFVSWYIRQENKAEAEELARIGYYGKYVEWPGTVDYIPVIDGEPRVQWTVDTNIPTNPEKPPENRSYYSATIVASFAKKEELFSLGYTKRIQVRCRLSSVHWGFPQMEVRLNKCQLIQANKPEHGK